MTRSTVSEYMKENDYLEDDSTNILAREVNLVYVHHLRGNVDDEDTSRMDDEDDRSAQTYGVNEMPRSHGR